MSDRIHDAALLEGIVRELFGTCRECGCHGDSCVLPGTGERCVWIDKHRTLCSNPACTMATHKAARNHKYASGRAERSTRRGTKRKVKGRAA